MVLDAALLNTRNFKVTIRGKVEQSRERSSASPQLLSVLTIEKGAFGSPSTKVANFTYFYYFLIKAGNYAVCVIIHTFYTMVSLLDFVNPRTLHCLLIFIGDFVIDVEGTVWILVKDSLNALPGLSLFTSAFICIFPARPMRTCGFCLSFTGF